MTDRAEGCSPPPCQHVPVVMEQERPRGGAMTVRGVRAQTHAAKAQVHQDTEVRSDGADSSSTQGFQVAAE